MTREPHPPARWAAGAALALCCIAGCHGCNNPGDPDGAATTAPPAAGANPRGAAPRARARVPAGPVERLEFELLDLKEAAGREALGAPEAMDALRGSAQARVDRFPKEAYPRVLLGFAHLYRHLLGRQPTQPDARAEFETVLTLTESGHPELTLDLCRAFAHYGTCLLARLDKNPALALARLDQARELLPDFWLFTAERAALYGQSADRRERDLVDATFAQAHEQGRGKFRLYAFIAEYYFRDRSDAVRAAQWWEQARTELRDPAERFQLAGKMFQDALDEKRFDEALRFGEEALALTDGERPAGDPEDRAKISAVLVRAIYLPRATEEPEYFARALDRVREVEVAHDDALTGTGADVLRGWWYLHYLTLAQWRRDERAAAVRAFLDGVQKAAPEHPHKDEIARERTRWQGIEGAAEPHELDALDEAWFAFQRESLSRTDRVDQFRRVVAHLLDRRSDPDAPRFYLDRLIALARDPLTFDDVRNYSVKVIAAYGERGRQYQDALIAILKAELDRGQDLDLIANCTQSLLFLLEPAKAPPELAQVALSVLRYAVTLDGRELPREEREARDIDAKELAFHATNLLHRLTLEPGLPYGTLETAEERAQALKSWTRTLAR